MAEEQSLSLEERVAYLEDQNEGLKRVGLMGLVLILLLGGLLVHRTWADLQGITTEGVVLRDENGSRLALTTTPPGHLAVVSFDQLGALPQISHNVAAGLRGIAIYDSSGAPRVMLGVTQNDEPVVAVLDPDGSLNWTPLAGLAGEEGDPKASPTPGQTPAASPSPTPDTTMSTPEAGTPTP